MTWFRIYVQPPPWLWASCLGIVVVAWVPASLERGRIVEFPAIFALGFGAMLLLSATARFGLDTDRRRVLGGWPWRHRVAYADLRRLALFPLRGGVGLSLWGQHDDKPLVICRLLGPEGRSRLDAARWTAIRTMVAAAPQVITQVYDSPPGAAPQGAALTLAHADVLSLLDDQRAALDADRPAEADPVAAIVREAIGRPPAAG